ncbi:terminase gpA endonuclease subunit [Paracoccus sp. IB05]|uniref:terminase gpA endonuclease subunit n=1 Tax=Paracoccus sp. IB05 TaxID=2779367 RepID=UPI0018E8B5F4|nr:terminase gpA endonuclease subunit [Paracoccus sp. IB05]MBJ2150640.1 phage terminase large subunit family protein [Paracoccus sp. IB05]
MGDLSGLAGQAGGIGVEPLPPYTDPRSALKRALPSLRPGKRVSVTASAEQHMRVNVSGQWKKFRADVAPYMVEPTDMSASRQFRALVFAGPSQSGKTLMLQTVACHAIMSDPGRVALFQMTRDAAQLMEREKIAPVIYNSPDLKARLAQGRGSDTIFQKIFTGGTHLTLDYPTPEKLASTTVRTLMATDFDRPAWGNGSIGDGDPYTQMRARTRTYMSRGMVIIESSPGAPIRDENWKPQSPHDCPPVAFGVLSLYPDGTRGRWYVPCPDCGAFFEMTFARLVYPDSADPAEAGEAARMRCPHCRETFGHELKGELNREGRWLHESAPADDGKIRLVSVDHSDLRRTDMLSYWLDGASAAFSTWAELVSAYQVGLRHFEATGDEEKLRGTVTTGQAQPYLPRSASSEMEITLDALKDKAQDMGTQKGTAPSWARYITVSIDVQGTYFSVGVTAWGEGGKHQPIDRFDLIKPPETAPGASGRTLKPGDYAEDWAVLEELSERVWPVEGGEWGLKAVSLAVDLHGPGSTTDHAYKFYRARRKAGEARRWHLTRGSGGLNHTDRVWLKAPERASGKRRVASDIKILNMATDRLKDAVAVSLRLTEDGQNICLIPEWMSVKELTELTAERRTLSGWEKRPGMVRNESLDHLVQARAQHIIIGAEKVDWSNPGRSWAVLSIENEFAMPVGRDSAGHVEEGPPAEVVISERQADRSPPARDGWISETDGDWL